MKTFALAAVAALTAAVPAAAQHHAEAVYKARVAAEQTEQRAAADAALRNAVADDKANSLDESRPAPTKPPVTDNPGA